MRCHLQSNILTIDVEDWYSDLNLNKWEFFQDRIIQKINQQNFPAYCDIHPLGFDPNHSNIKSIG